MQGKHPAPTQDGGNLLATQALLPDTTGRHQMKLVPYLTSHDGPGRVQLEG
jgi:hypothetical protein